LPCQAQSSGQNCLVRPVRSGMRSLPGREPGRSVAPGGLLTIVDADCETVRKRNRRNRASRTARAPPVAGAWCARARRWGPFSVTKARRDRSWRQPRLAKPCSPVRMCEQRFGRASVEATARASTTGYRVCRFRVHPWRRPGLGLGSVSQKECASPSEFRRRTSVVQRYRFENRFNPPRSNRVTSRCPITRSAHVVESKLPCSSAGRSDHCTDQAHRPVPFKGKRPGTRTGRDLHGSRRSSPGRTRPVAT